MTTAKLTLHIHRPSVLGDECRPIPRRHAARRGGARSMAGLSERLTPDERDKMARRLRAARQVKKLTALAVAEGCGVHVNSVVHWEWLKGRAAVPSDESRAKLAELYEVPESVLFAELLAHEAAARELLAG